MQIFNIDIDNIRAKLMSNHLYEPIDIGRKITMELIKHRNEIILETNKNFNNILVGVEIYTEFSDINSFHVSITQINKHIVHVGILAGMDIFIEYYGLLKPNQYVFFDNIETLSSDIKRYYRDKKLERILNVTAKKLKWKQDH